MAAAVSLVDQELVSIEEKAGTVISISDRGRSYAVDLFPERRALDTIKKAGGKVKISGLEHLLTIPDMDTRRIIKWLIQKEWCRKEEDSLVITPTGEKAFSLKGQDEILIDTLLDRGSADTETLKGDGVDTEEALKLLKGRPGIVKVKSRTFRSLDLTEQGLDQVSKGIEPLKEASVLTYEMLATGKWKDVRLKAYDVDLPSAAVYPGKSHPLRRIVDEARQAFLTMGFTEINSPHVEMSFWVFDALYQPQDHPAREMQDTFYLSLPKESKLPDREFVDAVKATHENGGTTGSTGWGYAWDPRVARTNVLRTHTTATTIRYLAKHPAPPAKVFNIGRVFRREKTTYKHLVEFYQVDGIVIDEKANLSTLLGSLTQFYKKMGFPKVSFRPSFFPYTEPSVEAFGWLESKKAWIELGGAGIFRAEVTRPFNCDVPVLAWGLSMERVAMMRFGLNDIRKLYWSDLDWLREAELCR
jgi:phenylalanyl-tRNA synthetase alpha chain